MPGQYLFAAKKKMLHDGLLDTKAALILNHVGLDFVLI